MDYRIQQRFISNVNIWKDKSDQRTRCVVSYPVKDKIQNLFLEPKEIEEFFHCDLKKITFDDLKKLTKNLVGTTFTEKQIYNTDINILKTKNDTV